MGYFSIFTPKQHAHPGATTGMTLWKTELTSHKVALFCSNPCLTKNYWQAQSVIHSLATRPSSPGSLRCTRNSQGESLTSRLYSVVLSYRLMISYLYTHPSTEASSKVRWGYSDRIFIVINTTALLPTILEHFPSLERRTFQPCDTHAQLLQLLCILTTWVIRKPCEKFVMGQFRHFDAT